MGYKKFNNERERLKNFRNKKIQEKNNNNNNNAKCKLTTAFFMNDFKEI